MQYFTTNLSVALTLLASLMWGSWMQIIKHRGKYPITGIIFLLYTFSLVLVGAATFLLAPFLLEGDIWAITVSNASIAGEIIMGGALMSAGLYLSLEVMNAAGLLIATTVSGAASSILGILTSLAKEGVPDRPGAMPLIVLSTAVFLLAGMICNAASQSRDRDFGKTEKASASLQVILLSFLSAIFLNGWSIGTATGTANGFPPVLTCLYMALGSFLGAAVLCGASFTKQKQWKQILCLNGHPKKPLLLGTIAAICHYGGNLISIYSMPALSATLSFLFGRASGLVTIGWGLYYGEFKGSSRKTKLVLGAGISAYFLAIALLGYYTYG